MRLLYGSGKPVTAWLRGPRFDLFKSACYNRAVSEPTVRTSLDIPATFLPEPPDLEKEFRRASTTGVASPKVWADALLVAMAIGDRAQVISFDRALQTRAADCRILK
jgi:hypothetical protein